MFHSSGPVLNIFFSSDSSVEEAGFKVLLVSKPGSLLDDSIPGSASSRDLSELRRIPEGAGEGEDGGSLCRFGGALPALSVEHRGAVWLPVLLPPPHHSSPTASLCRVILEIRKLTWWDPADETCQHSYVSVSDIPHVGFSSFASRHS